MRVTELNDVISKHSHVIVQYINGAILAETDGSGPLPKEVERFEVMLIEAVDNTLLITVMPSF